jgi:hypothetical protein
MSFASVTSDPLSIPRMIILELTLSAQAFVKTTGGQHRVGNGFDSQSHLSIVVRKPVRQIKNSSRVTAIHEYRDRYTLAHGFDEHFQN